GAPGAGAPRDPRHRAVDQVGEDERGDEQRAPPQLSPRVEPQRSDDDPERAHGRDDVLVDPEAEQQPGERGEDAGEGAPGVAVEHRPVSPAATRPGAAGGCPRAAAAAPWSGRRWAGSW